MASKPQDNRFSSQNIQVREVMKPFDFVISGKIHTGDQLMMVDGFSLIGVEIQEAQKTLAEVFKSEKVLVEPALQLNYSMGNV